MTDKKLLFETVPLGNTTRKKTRSSLSVSRRSGIRLHLMMAIATICAMLPFIWP